jgi:hypothetical protein
VSPAVGPGWDAATPVSPAPVSASAADGRRTEAPVSPAPDGQRLGTPAAGSGWDGVSPAPMSAGESGQTLQNGTTPVSGAPAGATPGDGWQAATGARPTVALPQPGVRPGSGAPSGAGREKIGFPLSRPGQAEVDRPYMDADGSLHNLRPIGRLETSGPDTEPRRYADTAFGGGWFVSKAGAKPAGDRAAAGTGPGGAEATVTGPAAGTGTGSAAATGTGSAAGADGGDTAGSPDGTVTSGTHAAAEPGAGADGGSGTTTGSEGGTTGSAGRHASKADTDVAPSHGGTDGTGSGGPADDRGTAGGTGNETSDRSGTGNGNETGDGNGSGHGNETGDANGTGDGNATGDANGTGQGPATANGNGVGDGDGGETGSGTRTAGEARHQAPDAGQRSAEWAGNGAAKAGGAGRPAPAAVPIGPELAPHLPLTAAELSAIRWRLDGATLREVVDNRDALRALGERLDGPLTDEADNIVKAGLLSVRAEVYRLLGELGMAAAASRLALAHAESAHDLQSMVIAQAELAHVLRLRGDYMEADRLFQKAVEAEVSPAVRSVVHENAGRSCFDQGRHMEALDHFARAIRLGAAEDTDLVERIGVCLEAVYIHVLRDGWGPYPRRSPEILTPLGGRPAADGDQGPVAADAFTETTAEQPVVRPQR